MNICANTRHKFGFLKSVDGQRKICTAKWKRYQGSALERVFLTCNDRKAVFQSENWQLEEYPDYILHAWCFTLRTMDVFLELYHFLKERDSRYLGVILDFRDFNGGYSEV